MAMAVNARSPPESSIIFCKIFPGGWAMISMPPSKAWASSAIFKWAWPPPNSSRNTCPKFRFITANLVRNCCSIRSANSVMTPSNWASACRISSRWLVRKSYRSFVVRYSSMAWTLTFPKACMALLMDLIFCTSSWTESSSLAKEAAWP